MDQLGSTPTTGVVAIACDDSWAHVHPTIADLLDHPPAHADEGGLGAVEFFDADGRRLAAVLGPGWELTDLRPTAEAPDGARLLRRLRTVFGHVAQYLRDHPEVVPRLPSAPDDLQARLQRLSQANLDEVIDECLLATADDPGHSGSWLHNALHASGWKH
jgi:hypothetical protein